MKIFSSLVFQVTHSQLPGALAHQVRIVILKSGFSMRELVPALASYDTASKVFE